MAKYFFLPKRVIERAPWIRTPAWILEAAVFQILFWLARVLPFALVSTLFARLIGGVARLNQKKRHVLRRNLAVVLPRATPAGRDRVMGRVFHATGLAAAELFLLDRLWRRRDRHLEFSVDPQAQSAIDRKDAIVFATAHVGAWQLCNLIAREGDLSISVLYAQEPNPWLHRFFLARRRAFGGRMVPSTGGARAFIRELAAGRSVGAAFDTSVDLGEMVPFFGVETPTSTLPAMLALRGHTLIPIRALRLPRCRYRIEVLAPLNPASPEAARKDQILDLTTQLNHLFEQWIREDPGQWVCMKRRWPKPPAGLQAADV